MRFMDAFCDEITKLAQYRERVEVYGVTPGGRILGGIYPDDQSFGVYGGGVDLGETPEEAGYREYLEEAGRKVTNIRPITKNNGAIDTLIQPWLDHDMSEKQRQRAKEFPGGTKNYYLIGQLGRSANAKDTSDTSARMQDVRLRPVKDVIDVQQKALKGDHSPEVKKRMRKRLSVLKKIEQEILSQN